jgi:hypothetical protein
MSRPLVAKQGTEDAADEFHRAVFKAHGRTCYFYGTRLILDAATRKPRKRTPEERCEKDATDAMHVVPRSQLGPKSRFACPEENGRPGCRTCHNLEDVGRLDFPDAVYNRAIRALQKVTPRIGLRER